MRYYVYRHIRLDTNEPFYIGVGTKSPEKRIKGYNTEYSRAFEIAKRSTFWKNVIAKTAFKIEILFESDNKDIINKKEQEFIALYGMRWLDQGSLVNFSQGGDSHNGPKNHNVRISQMDLEDNLIKIWEQLRYIQEQTGFLKTNIVKCCRKKQLTAYGFTWKYTDDTSYDDVYATAARKKTNNRAGVIAINRHTKEELSFRSSETAALYFSVHRTTVWSYIQNETIHKTHDFKYRSWYVLKNDGNPIQAKEAGLSESRLQ